MNTDCVWASNYAFLNDPSERVYCIDKAEEAMNQVCKGRAEIVPKLFKAISNRLHGEGIRNEYIASFCEDADLLSQWRAYGGEASGYSIGFDAARLIGKLRPRALLKKVIYNPTLQNKILISVCEIVADFAEKEIAERGVAAEGALDHYALHCAEPISALCAEMKHEAYAEEKEWRLVYSDSTDHGRGRRPSDVDLFFRTRGSTIVPYVKLPFGEKNGAPEGNDYHPVVNITVGPMDNSGVAKKGVELLCKSRKREIVVERSRIPTRAF
jgi:hypothetical protein